MITQKRVDEICEKVKQSRLRRIPSLDQRAWRDRCDNLLDYITQQAERIEFEEQAFESLSNAYEKMVLALGLLKEAVEDADLSDYSLRVVAGILSASLKDYTPEEIELLRSEIPARVFERVKEIHASALADTKGNDGS